MKMTIPYNEDDNPGDFMFCLKHSTVRYLFYKDILGPKMFEFEPKDSAEVKYLDLLKLEYYLEDFMMQYGAGTATIFLRPSMMSP